MTQSRPNYILELKDRTIEFVYADDESYKSPSGKYYYEHELKDIGATPVPQEEPEVEYVMHVYDKPGRLTCKGTLMHFKSHEDAENYRLRCESIGPEWNDGKKYSDPLGDGFTFGFQLVFGFPTEERRQEWLDRFGKAWGLK